MELIINFLLSQHFLEKEDDINSYANSRTTSHAKIIY